MTTIAKSLKVSAILASLLAVPALADEAMATGGVSYSHIVLTKISDHAVYPRIAALRSEEGVVTLSLVVDHSGNVADVKLLDSSGVPAIDHAALQAALTAAPYPAPVGQQEEVKGRIRFQM